MVMNIHLIYIYTRHLKSPNWLLVLVLITTIQQNFSYFTKDVVRRCLVKCIRFLCTVVVACAETKNSSGFYPLNIASLADEETLLSRSREPPSSDRSVTTCNHLSPPVHLHSRTATRLHHPHGTLRSALYSTHSETIKNHQSLLDFNTYLLNYEN